MLNKTTFSSQERFREYKILSNNTSSQVGPGSYNDMKVINKIKERPCTAIYKS